MKWYHWAWLPLVILTAVVIYVLRRGDKSLVETLATELQVIEAQTEAKRLAKDKGVEHARIQIESEHRATIKKLDAGQKDEALRLRSDPVALAVFLTRLG